MIRGIYTGGRLADLFSEAVEEATRQTAKRIVSRGGEFLHDRAVAYTPIRTGLLREQWIETEGRDGDVLSATVANHSKIAAFAEFGTKPHSEAPKDEKAELTPEGPRAGVHHPGSEGHFMATRAAADLQVALPEIAQPLLEAWKAEAQEIARRHPGIT